MNKTSGALANMSSAEFTALTLSRLEEDDYDLDGEMSLQEELNEILEAFFELVSEEDIKAYQKLVEKITEKKVAEGALKVNDIAPDFTLRDQDGEDFNLQKHLAKGLAVVLIFYRGKWCPHCNATLMRYQKYFDALKAKGATLVALSPMLPDGTAALATKQLLEFPVLSDVGSKVARQFKVSFAVPEEVRSKMSSWGEDVPTFNGDCTWEIPLPATYIIHGNDRKIVWSCVDNDPGIRAEPADVVAAIPAKKATTTTTKERKSFTERWFKSRKRRLQWSKSSNNSGRSTSHESAPSPVSSTDKGVTFKVRVCDGAHRLFGRKKQKAVDYIANFQC